MDLGVAGSIPVGRPILISGNQRLDVLGSTPKIGDKVWTGRVAVAGEGIAATINAQQPRAEYDRL